MRYRAQLALTALAAAALLAAAVGSASANRLSVSSQSIRVVWRPLHFFSGSIGWRCNLTLEGSFHARTIVKTVGSLIGHITRAIRDTCSFEGGASALTILTATLPWHLTYEGFSGTLPNPTGVRISLVNFSLLLTAIGFSCLYRSTAEQSLNGIANVGEGGRVTGITAEEGESIPKFSGSGFCPEELNVRNTSGPVTQLGTTTQITIRLI